MFQNIAEQAHGFSGVNKALKEYNRLTDQSARISFAETVSQSNETLGKYLNGLNGATAGLFNYAKALATVTLKTSAATAISTVVRFSTTAAIDAIMNGISYLMNYDKIQREVFENAKKATEETLTHQIRPAPDMRRKKGEHI